MPYQVYDVKCSNCGNTDRVGINKYDKVDWISMESVISCRKRFDGQWGFQCKCGNNDLVTPEENKYWLNQNIMPQPQEMKSIMNNLKQRKSKFEMVGV
jgi:hypothetical protein